MNEPDVLTREILLFLTDRKYEPGERIPSERELTDRFATTRSHLRTTVGLLENLRIIERRAKSGLFMATGNPSIEALVTYSNLGMSLGEVEVGQIVELRLIHETEAARLASERRTESDLTRMREILAASEESLGDPLRFADLDREFHLAVVGATQNEIFLRVVEIFYAITGQTRPRYFAQTDRRRRSFDDHALIAQAIELQDADNAVELIKNHLKGADSHWKTLLRKGAIAQMPVTDFTVEVDKT